jgi:transglutaminase-like putative cysteine protease
VTIITVEPVRYVKSMTGTGADLGLAYLEIPLEEIRDPFLNVTARFRFVQHSQQFTIDPAKVKPYNTSSPEYLKYTTPGKNIVITPEMKKKAQEIVGNETNPYFQAQKIYWNVVDTHPYSHPPLFLLESTNTPLSAYVLTTGIGDCGSQSQYFAALCRSLGIPARVPAGYQMINPGTGDIHVWAEYYLEGYGWIPVDVTVAEGAEWSYNATADERHRYKEYFFGSLDPNRYIIQNDVDVPLTPGAGDAVVFSRNVIQNPDAICDTCTDNPGILIAEHWTVTLTKG